MATYTPRNQQQARPKNYRDFINLSLYTDAPSGGPKRSRFVPGMLNENFRFSCYPNDPSEAKDNPQNANKGIVWAVRPTSFQRMVQIFMSIATGAPDKKQPIASMTHGSYEEGGSRGPLVLRSTLWIGKDPEGIVWVCVRTEGRPVIRFDFDGSIYDIFHDPVTGKPLNRDKNSQDEAVAWITLLTNAYSRSFPVEDGYQIVDGQRTAASTTSYPASGGSSASAGAASAAAPAKAVIATGSFDDIAW